MKFSIRPRTAAALLAAAIGATFALSYTTAEAIEPWGQAVHTDPGTLAPGTFAIDPDSPTTMPRSIQPDAHDAAGPVGGTGMPSRGDQVAPPNESNAAPDTDGAPVPADNPPDASSLQALSTGNNGAVSANELFYRLDVNHDNRLTPDEVKSVPALADRFLELDGDRDGALSRTELSDFDPMKATAK